MALRDEEEQKHNEVEQNPVNTEQALAPVKPSHFTHIGLFIIALGALGFSAYNLVLNQNLKIEHSLLSNELQQNKNDFASQTKQLQETQLNLEHDMSELNKQFHSALNQRFYQNHNWLLLKARYYLELAQINAHWSNTHQSSIELLQQADHVLAQLSDPKVFVVRQKIATDIAQLKAIPTPDIVGILSQIDAAQKSLDGLKSVSSFPNNIEQNANATPKKTSSAWRLRIQDSMDLLSKLVVIRRNDEQIKPLPSPTYEALIKENIRLNLQEAQWAVLHNNPQAYQMVLEQAIHLLKKNFNENAATTTALIQKLSQLKTVQLDHENPEINTALPLLNQLIKAQEHSTISQEGASQ